MTEIWHTIETSPRRLIVSGIAAIDPDCLVAYLDEADAKPLWIVEASGYVCGLEVYAHRVFD